jgi:dephospho-CoA kinase
MAGEVPREGRLVVLIGGGIGAGKSTIAALFGERGFSVLSADLVGHDVLADGSPTVAEVAERWPEVVTDGSVDRSALARIVFADSAELDALEAMTHPEIARRLRTAIRSADRPVVVEVPVLGVLDGDDAVRIAVVAEPEIRIARAVARGGDPVDVRNRMARQPSDDEWSEWASLVVDSSRSWAETEHVAVAVIEELVSHG